MNSNNRSTNEWVDYWREVLGMNVIPADTANKITNVRWKEWQDKPIPKEQHEKWKRENAFSKGMAIIVGKTWYKSDSKDLKLVFIDADNQKAIDEICKIFKVASLNELSQICIVNNIEINLTKHISTFTLLTTFRKRVVMQRSLKKPSRRIKYLQLKLRDKGVMISPIAPLHFTKTDVLMR